MVKRWTEEEIQFLRFAYPNKDFTKEEILKGLEGKTCQAIRAKASNLGLKRYKEVLPVGFKRCTHCKTILPIEDFANDKRRKNSKASHCKVCHRKRYIDYCKRTKTAECTKTAERTKTAETKICKKCGIEKPLSEFTKNKNMKDGRLNTCKECSNEERRIRYIKGGY